MTLADQLTTDLHAAMKSGDSKTRDVLRFAITAVKNETVSAGHELNDDETEAVLARLKKQLDQAASEYESLGNSERATDEAEQSTIIARYLPAPLTDKELSAEVSAAVEATAATSSAQMGLVIQAVKARVGNRADGGRIATLVKEALTK